MGEQQYLVLDLSDQIKQELGTKALLRRKGFFVARNGSEASRLALASWYSDRVEGYLGACLNDWHDSCDEYSCGQPEALAEGRFATWGRSGVEVLLYVVDLSELEDLGLVVQGTYVMGLRDSLRDALCHLAEGPDAEVLDRASASARYLLASPLRVPAIRAALAEGFEKAT